MIRDESFELVKRCDGFVKHAAKVGIYARVSTAFVRMDGAKCNSTALSLHVRKTLGECREAASQQVCACFLGGESLG